MAEQRPDLSIVIVSYNTRDLTRQCLQSVYENTQGIGFEIRVVDNSSSDDSVEAIQQEFPQVHIIENDANKGLAAATNQGLAASAGRYVLALNSDTVIQAGALDRLVQFMDSHPDAGGATARLVRPDGGEHPPVCGKVPTPKFELLEALAPFSQRIASAASAERLGNVIDYTDTQEVPCIWWGTAFVARCEVIETVGLQDPRFFVYGEDVDWSMRMTKAGWKLYYVADAEVIHHGGQSTKQAGTKMNAQMYKSRCRLIRKHYGVLPSTALRLVLVTVCSIRAAKWVLLYVTRPSVRQKAARRVSEMWAVTRAVITY